MLVNDKAEFIRTLPEHNERARRAAPAGGYEHFDLTEDVIRDGTDQFVLLGGNITNVYEEYNKNQVEKQLLFFKKLHEIPLHPHIKFLLLRICGGPRLQYYTSITPPEHSAPVLKIFQDRLRAELRDILGFEPPADLLHEQWGLGMPNYVDGAAALYNETMTKFLDNEQHDRQPAQRQHESAGKSVMMSLVANTCGPGGHRSTAHLQGQQQAEWLHFAPNSPGGMLNPAEFCMAMAIRLLTCPVDFADRVSNTRCTGCNAIFQSPAEIIQHAVNCGIGGTTYVPRHEAVVRAIVRLLRQYGFAVTLEPENFVYAGANHNRPDILVHVIPALVTDVTVVMQDGKVGVAAKRAAAEKTKKHEQAVNDAGAQFCPFALEVHGHTDACVDTFWKHLAQHLESYKRWQFLVDARHAVSTALARWRADKANEALQRAQLFASHIPRTNTNRQQQSAGAAARGATAQHNASSRPTAAHQSSSSSSSDSDNEDEDTNAASTNAPPALAQAQQQQQHSHATTTNATTHA